MAIVLLVSIAKGVQQDIQKQVESLGVNLLIVVPFRMPTDGGMSFNPNMAGLSYLREREVGEIRKLEGVRNAVPWVFPGGKISVGSKELGSALIIATEPQWFRMRPFEFREGRAFGDQESSERVVVLGEIAKEYLFASRPALGQTVTIGGETYRVVGVTKREGQDSLFSSAGLSNIVLIPYRYIAAKLEGPPLSRILIQTEPDVEPKALIAKVESVLRKRLNEENFSVITQKDLLRVLFSVMGVLTSLLFGLTSIALIVGGLGIMTVMLMAVGERSKEIGIRKTVGARRSDIFAQFLSEAVALSLLGGLGGLIVSYLACLVLQSFTKLQPLITWQTVGLSFGVSVLVGGIFGLVPAMKAARQDPVQSLRSE